MDSLIPELVIYGSKNECARTNTLLLPLAQVSTGEVSLISKCWPKIESKLEIKPGSKTGSKTGRKFGAKKARESKLD